jgi:chemotaxis protein methyltransferase CheR
MRNSDNRQEFASSSTDNYQPPVGSAAHSGLQPLVDIEIDLLLEGVYRHYGYDFRSYSRSSVKRRVLLTLEREGVSTVSGLQTKVLHDAACMNRLIHALSVNVTSMFRDPEFFATFRSKVVPLLRTYPFVRIWNAGCSTGEEAYSMAIVLSEEGLYDRCSIYATDISATALEKAEAGVYPLSELERSANTYRQAGGTGDFSAFYKPVGQGSQHGSGQTRAESVPTAHRPPPTGLLDPSLRRNIVFAEHNLVVDGTFNEFNVVLCRNVLIYFNRELQDRVHGLLYESLAMFGVLGLGKQETIRLTSHQGCYKELDGPARLYRKVA